MPHSPALPSCLHPRRTPRWLAMGMLVATLGARLPVGAAEAPPAATATQAEAPLPVSLPAQLPPADPNRYAVRVTPLELAAALSTLSASEFRSITPAPSFLPLMLPEWQQGPPLGKGWFGLGGGTYAGDPEVALQTTLLLAATDPTLRARTVVQISNARNPSALPALLQQLAREQDQQVQADLLRGLARLGLDNQAPAVAPLLASPLPAVRAAAATLYARQQGAQADVLGARLPAEVDLSVRLALWQGLTLLRTGTAWSLWAGLLEHHESVELAAGLPALLAFPEAAAQGEALGRLASGPEVAVKIALANGLPTTFDAPLAARLLTQLGQDPHSAVRAAAAAASGRLRAADCAAMLVRLSTDPAPAVRLAAAEQLRTLPSAAGLTALIDCLGDATSPLVREMAYASLLAMAATYPVDANLGPAFAHASPEVRLRAARLTVALQSTRHHDALAALLLRADERPVNRAATIRALAVAHGTAEGSAIMALAADPAGEVRAAVAFAIGRLGLPESDELLEHLAVDDHANDVRHEALMSMGWLAHPRYLKPMLTVLQRTNYTNEKNPEYLSSDDRATACWALARQPALTHEVVTRLQALVTSPVVAVPMSPPSYDSDPVRISAGWALVLHARRSPDKELQQVMKRSLTMLETEPPTGGGGLPPPSSPEMRYYATQARCLLEDQPIPHQVLSPDKSHFDYERLDADK